MTESRAIAIVHEAGFSKRLAIAMQAFSEARGFECELLPLAHFDDENAAPMKDQFLQCDAAVFMFDSETDFVHPQLRWMLDAGAKDTLTIAKQPVAVLGIGLPVNKLAQRVYSLLVCNGSTSTKQHAAYIERDTGAEDFQKWMIAVWDMFAANGLSSRFPMKYQAQPRDNQSPSAKPTRFKKATVVDIEKITSPEYPRSSFLLTLDYGDAELNYKPGDHVVILPENESRNVSRILQALHMTGQETVEVLDLVGAKVEEFPSLGISLADIFRYYLDIQGRASRRFLATVALLATSEKEAEDLTEMAINFKEGSPYSMASKGIFSHVDVFEKFPSIAMTIAQACSAIPLQRHRSYSASSSPLQADHQIQLTFTVLSFPTSNGLFTGLSTGYMSRLKKGDTVAMTIENGGITLDLDDPHNVCVGVALGSGVAMLRGIAQHFALLRTKLNKPAGKMLLYYGVRHQKQDFMFGEELTGYHDSGILNLVTAFSHDQPEFITPAHRMKDDPETLCCYLLNPQCIFYYCGPAGPAYSSVESGIKDAVKAARPDVDVEQLIASMRKQGRWQAQAYTPTPDPEDPFA